MPILKALTIAGSDSGGGAGIQADLKTFSALGVYGCSVITAVTAQNTRGVTGVEPISPQMVQLQIEAVLSDIQPQVIKTGMLANAEIIRTVT
ncbi:MAG: bifunctional hydroxymethylpyrimidine kinase/phosphomethylpyrimidine kinase, partial [Pyrinomonadaceae bacterium]